MSDFGTMKARIADEMKRGDLTASATAVQSAVLSAIDYWRWKRFPFNQARDTSILTTASDPFLTSMPTGILYLHSIKLTIGGNQQRLYPRAYDWMETVDFGAWTGYPEYYAWYTRSATASQVLRLYPIPNGAFTATMSFTRSLPEITAGATSTASNAWMTIAEPVIRMWAKGVLFDHHLRAAEHANRMYQLARQEYQSLRRETNAKQGSGSVMPLRW